MMLYNIPVLTTTEYRPEIIGIECRSRARRRVLHFDIQNSLIDIRYFQSMILPRFEHNKNKSRTRLMSYSAFVLSSE
jgi:hypothetical protein